MSVLQMSVLGTSLERCLYWGRLLKDVCIEDVCIKSKLTGADLDDI